MKSGRALPNRTSGERDANQPQVRDQTGPSFRKVTNPVNSGEVIAPSEGLDHHVAASRHRGRQLNVSTVDDPAGGCMFAGGEEALPSTIVDLTGGFGDQRLLGRGQPGERRGSGRYATSNLSTTRPPPKRSTTMDTPFCVSSLSGPSVTVKKPLLSLLSH